MPTVFLIWGPEGVVGVGVTIALEVVAIPEFVEDPENVETGSLVELGENIPVRWYIFNRPPPPQNSVRLPTQVILQSVAGAEVAPLAILLPHQHSPPYSIPIYGRF